MSDINFETYEAQVLECSESNEREAVLANLRGGTYKRVKDIEADIADLQRRDEARRAADAAQATEATE